jgi:hypothetical protein
MTSAMPVSILADRLPVNRSRSASEKKPAAPAIVNRTHTHACALTRNAMKREREGKRRKEEKGAIERRAHEKGREVV